MISLQIAELASKLERLEISPVDVVENCISKIDQINPKLNAFLTIASDSARRAAKVAEDEIRAGKYRGPLHGIPIGVKDIFYTAGMKTTAGSKVMENFIPPFDSTAVQRLKKAGAIVLGKTATTEFAHADPAPTHNPWNLDHTPGGSSSGSAAAVATCMCPAALGSQTGGSVLRPAAYCGVVGLKPTYGRISRYGVFPFSWTLDHVGFFTRSVADAAILLGVLAGHDPHDPSTSKEPVPDYTKSGKPARKPPRMGVVQAFYQEKSEGQVWSHTKKIMAKLEKAGAPIVEVEMPPSFAVVQDAHRTIMRVEGAAFHEKLFEQNREKYRPKLRELVQIGLLIPGVDYLRAQKIKRLFRRDMEEVMQKYDCLLTPTTSSPAPQGLFSTGNPWFQVPWSLSGLPTINLPSGLSKEGLPLGIQLVGSACGEAKLLAIARWCEKVLQVSLSPKVG